MLELRPNCECCGCDLPPAGNAYICTYECTWCAQCAQAFDHICPNCGGNLVQRPIRPAELLAKDPPSTVRVFNPSCQEQLLHG